MKKLGFGVLAAVLLAGCGGDDDGGGVNGICSFVYENDDYDFSSLTADQQKELKKIYIKSCEKYYNNLPVCKSEIIDNAECVIAENDYAEKHESELKQIQNECLNSSGSEDEYHDCLKKNKYPCINEALKANKCIDTNEKVLDDYDEEDEKNNDTFELLKSKLEEWGLKIYDYIVEY